MRRSIVAILGIGLVAWIAFGILPRFVLAVRIIDALRAPRPDAALLRSTPRPLESGIVLEARGRRLAADLYRPGHGRPATPMLFVPGAVELGRNDARVAPFARILARAGFTVVVPDLPSVRALRVHPENQAELGAALEALTARADLAPDRTAGLLGVSYAGGLALLVALDPAERDRVAFVATVGAFANLDTALRFIATGRTSYRGVSLVVTPDPYGRLVFLRTAEEFLPDSDTVLLETMVRRRFGDPGAALGDLAAGLGPQGRSLYDLFETAPPERVSALIARLPQGLHQRMGILSPDGRDFAALRAPLFLVHARRDRIFPVREIERLEALARPHARVRAVVLESLDHVAVEPWNRRPLDFLRRELPEAWRLAWWWVDLLGQRR